MAKPNQKKAAPPANKKTTALATTGSAKPPAVLMKRMQEDAGKGLSKSQDDNLVPMIVILQKLSPQCDKRDAKFMPGAEESKLWLKGCDTPFVDANIEEGGEGIVVQPCHFSRAFVEWKPRSSGGGFIAQHAEMPRDAKQQRDPQNKDKMRWMRPNGNEVIDTRYHVVRVHLDDGRKLAYVLPLSSTGHTVSKDWMFRMNNRPADGAGGESAPSWAYLYRLRTKIRNNAAGTWFQLVVEDVGWCSEEDYEQGLALFNAFEKGEKKADTRDLEPEGSDEDGDSV